MSWDWQWKPYVSVAERKAQAGREMRALQKKGLRVEPIEIVAQNCHYVLGESWCTHLDLLAISKIAYRAGAPMFATAQFATWRSPTDR